MRKWSGVVAGFLLFLGAATAWAEPALQIPVQLGETEASIRQRLGEPSNIVDGDTNLFLWYPSGGFTVELDRGARTVIGVTLMGEFRKEGTSVYPGAVTNGVDMSRSFDQVVQALGSSYQKDTFLEEMGITSYASFHWDFDTFTLIGTFWLKDSNENGRVYPKGSLLSIQIEKK